MLHNFSILPIELQASVVELRAAGVPESAIDTLVTRMLAALEVKTNKVQADVWRIEASLGEKLEQIGNKLESDLQTQHGETNGMLVELRSAQQRAHPQIMEARQDVADIKKSWAKMDIWRGQVDLWRGQLDSRVEGMSGDLETVKAEIEKRKPFFEHMIAEIAQIKHENLQDELNREERQRLTADVRTIPDLRSRLTILEVMLERLTRLVADDVSKQAGGG